MKRKTGKLISSLSLVFLAAAICVAMLSLTGPLSAEAGWNGSTASAFASGNGTKASPYVIRTESQLAYFVSRLDAGVTYDGLYLSLENDLDMTGNVWSYSTAAKFQGTFEGNGHTITADCPFLKEISANGTVKGLNYHAAQVVSRSILCEDNYGTITGCVVLGEVDGQGGIHHAGLVCSKNYGTVIYCGGVGTVYASGKDTDSYCGLVAENMGTMDTCYAAVAASGSASGKYNDPYPDALAGSGNTPLNSYYNKELFTRSTNTGLGMTTQEMQGADFLRLFQGTAYAGIKWVKGGNGYPAVAPGSTLNAYVSGYQNDKTIIYSTSSQSFNIACTNSSAKVYYTLDGSDPTSSSTRKSISAGGSVSITGDAVLSLVPYYNGSYGDVNTVTVISMPGSGTAADPYQISSPYSLNAVRLFPDSCFRLTKDITFTDADYAMNGPCPGGWSPIPNFTGTLNGAGHSIYNMKGNMGGLVERNRGTITSLRMVDHELQGFGYSGAIANHNNGTITRCYAKSAFSATSAPKIPTNHDYTLMSTSYGGIAGSSSGTISYCRVEGTVYGMGGIHYFHTYLGGITGDGNATSCIVEATLIMLKQEHPDWVHIGGISGDGRGENCYTDIDVINYSSADYSLYCGGISGSYNQSSYAYRCVSENYELTIDLPGGYGIGSKYKSSFSYYSPYQCYLGGSKAASEYPDLDFVEDWMETDEGVRPQGVMDADGHAYSIDSTTGKPVCGVCGDGSTPAEIIASGTCGTNASWTLDENGLLTVYGTGDMTNYASISSAPWYAHRNAIKRVYISDGITSVGDRSFYEYPNIVSARLPEGLTNIGYYAFYHCSAMSTINLPSTLMTFGRSALCGTALTSVVVPDGVTSLHEWVFGENPHLVSVTLPDSLTIIGNCAFASCTNLQTVALGNKVTSIGEHAFENCTSLKSFVIPDSVTSMGICAFHLCSSLTDVTIGSGLTTLPQNAFTSCTSLKNVTFKGGITTIGDWAFSLCSALESIQIPSSVTTINYGAFMQSGLKEVVIPDSVTTMDIDVFANCPQLEKITFGSGLTSTERATLSCPNLKEVIIREGVTVISEHTFNSCPSLEYISIPDSVTTIEKQAFDGCTSLRYIVLPAGLRTVQAYAFEGCDALEHVLYKGTPSQWNAISISSTYNQSFINAMRHYNANGTEITMDGTTLTCSICDENSSVPEGTIANGSYNQGSNWFYWSITADGTLTISGTGPLTKTHSWDAPWADYVDSVKVLVIKEGITSLEYLAFSSHRSLVSVSLPASLEKVDTPFSSCTNLKVVAVHPNNPYLCSDELGVLFNKDKTTLIRMHEGYTGAYTIPESVTTIGAHAFDDTNLSQITFPSGLKVIGPDAFYSAECNFANALPNTLERIENGAFTISQLTAIHLPASVQYIGSQAFSCSNLKSITVAQDNPYFSSDATGALFNKDKTTLLAFPAAYQGAYIVPDSVTKIGADAFWFCDTLRAVHLPEGLTTISSNAFGGCDALTSITIPSTVTTISGCAFGHTDVTREIRFMGDAPDFGTGAFTSSSYETNTTHCSYPTGNATWDSKINRVYTGTVTWGAYTPSEELAYGMCGERVMWVLDESGNLIISGSGDMYDFDAGTAPWYPHKAQLRKVDIKQGVTGIGNYAFYQCTAMTSISISSTVTRYGDRAFSGWTTLANFTISANVSELGDGLFENCTSLSSVTLPNTLWKIGSEAFANCKSLVNFTVPDNVSVIGEGAFSGCTRLTNINIPNGVTQIADRTFLGCSSLKEIALHNNITQIGAQAFQECIALSAISIPAGVTAIGDQAFSFCVSLTDIAFYGNAPAFGGEAVFDSIIANATYSADNTTWNADVTQNYGGSITWKGVCYAGHTSGLLDAAEPTCTVPGYTGDIRCTVCDELLESGEEIPATGHTVVIDQAVEATCTETGLTQGTHCADCGEVLLAQQVIPAKGHAEVIDSAVEATCTATGLTEGKHCSVCNAVLVAQETIPATGHTEVIDPAVPATCTEKGLTEGKHCSVCDTVIVAQTTVAAKGHTEVIDQAVAATCTEKGLTEGKHCSVCDVILVAQKEVAAKGHTEVTDKAVAATCTATGLTEGKHCSVCNVILVAQKEVAAKGHTEVTDKAVAPTCTATGKTEGKHCSVCNTVLVAQTTVAAKGHTEVTDPMVSPTCTESGLTGGKHCSVCNAVLVAQKVVAAKGHTEVTDPMVAPTCTESGLTGGKHCSVCGTITLAQKVVAAKGHTEVTDKAVAATCTESGLTAGKHCSVCNAVTVKQETVPAKGHTEVIDKAIAATCTTSGLTEGKHCSVCTVILVAQKEVAAKGHSYKSTVVAPTAEAQGYTEHTCTACGDSYRDNFQNPLGHNTELKNAVDATCTKDGYTGDWVCKDCGKVVEKGSKIPAKGHTEVIDKAVAATCTENGLTEGKHCSVCNTVLTAQKEVKAKGHSFGGWYVTKAADCTNAGEEARDCANCDHTETRTIPAKGHTEVKDKAVAATCTTTGLTEGKHCSVCGTVITAQQTVPVKEHNYKTQVIAPTNTEQGYTLHTCKDCGHSYKDNFVDPTGHEPELKNVKEATCTETGYTGDWICKVCGETVTRGEVIPMKAHTEVIDAAKAPTCTASGLTEGKHCSVCNTVTVKQETVPAKGHTWDKGTVTREPTEDSAGVRTYTCTVCGEKKTETIPTLDHTHKYTSTVTAPTCTEKGYTTHTCPCGHSYVDSYKNAAGHKEVTDKAVAATCTASGLTEGKHCSVCNTVLTAQKVVPAKGHTEVTDKAVAATCTASGLTEGKHCSVCKAVTVPQNVVPAKGHTEVTDKAVAATCTENGLTEGKHCSVCNTVLVAQKKISALGHKEVTDKAIAATCTENGLTEGKHCSVCNAVTVAQKEVKAKGHKEAKDKAVEATCTTSGLTEGKHCSVCNEILVAQKEVAAKGHSYKSTVVAPTAEAQGYTEHTCTACGDSYRDNFQNPLGHNTELKNAVDATCTKDGYTGDWVCKDCGKVVEKGSKIPAKGHTEVIDKAVAATCTENGLTEGKHCSVCNTVLTAQKEVKAKGHSFGGWYVTKAADCTNAGEEARDCANCDHTETRTVSAKGHTEVKDKAVAATCTTTGLTEGKHCSVCGTVITAQQTVPVKEHNYKTQVVAPTNTEQGYTLHTCKDCGHSYKDNFVDPTGHEPELKNVKEATCTEAGYTGDWICKVCGETVTRGEVIPMKAHTEVIDAAKAPTCTATGLTEGKHCSVCNTVTVKQETVPAKGHTWDNGKVTKEPTENTEGVKTYTCLGCGETKTESIPVLGHTHAYTSTVTAPTCTENGYTTHTCPCGDSYVDSHTAAKGHTWSGWIAIEQVTETTEGLKQRQCTVCGEKETEVIPVISTAVNPFQDVNTDSYYRDPVVWASIMGITTGTTETTFAPTNACTRKQIVTFLWRAAGEPEPANMENPFTDVKADRFEKAILWAYYEGITSGKTATTFVPEETCTRKQVVTFLWRFNGKPETDTSGNPFTDVKRGDQFEKAIMWAYNEKITTGKTATTFQPEEPCTRSQVVTFLYRYMIENNNNPYAPQA